MEFAQDLLASLRHEVILLRNDLEACQQELKRLRDQLVKAGINADTPNQWP